jgi:YggT family protein
VLKNVLCPLTTVYILAIFGRIIFSWIPIAPESPVAAVRGFMVKITEPVMGPLRRALPPLRLGSFAIDLSPIIVLLVLQIVVQGAILQC